MLLLEASHLSILVVVQVLRKHIRDVLNLDIRHRFLCYNVDAKHIDVLRGCNPDRGVC